MPGGEGGHFHLPVLIHLPLLHEPQAYTIIGEKGRIPQGGLQKGSHRVDALLLRQEHVKAHIRIVPAGDADQPEETVHMVAVHVGDEHRPDFVDVHVLPQQAVEHRGSRVDDVAAVLRLGKDALAIPVRRRDAVAGS